MACLVGWFVKSLLGVRLSQCGCEEVWVVVMKVAGHMVPRRYVMLNVSLIRSKVLRQKC